MKKQSTGITLKPKTLPAQKVENGRRATISACMIVKNEEQMLPRCLASIRDLVDEIILVDTGSEDNTIAIAQEFNCTIHHFPWTGDFSAARNESIRHATGDWIFIIDADEEVPAADLEAFRRFVNISDARILAITVYNKSLETGEVCSFLPSVRLFRRDLDMSYSGIVHNRLQHPPGVPIVRCNARLFHYGYNLSDEQMDKKHARTRTLLEKQLESDPDNVYANFNMAQLLRSFRDAHLPENAELIIEHASRVIDNPESRKDEFIGLHLMALHQKSAGLLVFQRLEEAEACLKQALELYPTYLDPLVALGNLYITMNRFDDAERYFREYLSLKKKYRPEAEISNIIFNYLEGEHVVYYGLGHISEGRGRTDKAIGYFKEVLKYRPQGYIDTYSRLGKLYLDSNNASEAGKMFARDIALNPDSAKAFFGRGAAFSLAGEEKKALEDFTRAAKLAPQSAQMRFRVGSSLMLLGDKQSGKESILQAVALAPENMDIRYDAANVLFEAGDIETAEKLYREILNMYPDHYEARNNFANCLFRRAEYAAACAEYEQVITYAPEYWPAYRNLGSASIHLHEYEKGLSALMTYSEHNPADYPVYRLIGDILAAAGQLSDAIGCYEKYLSANGLDEHAWLSLAEAYLQLGFADSAVKGYRQVLAISPDNKVAAERLESLSQPQSTG